MTNLAADISAQETPTAEGVAEKNPEGSASPKETALSSGKVEETKTPEPPKEPEAPKPVVPEKYDLKVPEGSLLEASHVEKIASYAKEQGLSNEQAQQLLERDNAAVTGFAENQKKQLEQKSTEWVTELKSDKELGGDHFTENVEMASRVVRRFGTESFTKALNDTGLGNHPELVRVFARIGKMMSEDQLVIPGTQTPVVKQSMADSFYGGTIKE